MSRRKRKDWARIYSILDSKREYVDLSGFLFVFSPAQDRVAWQALQYYSIITPNVTQRDAILVWLKEHPCPGEPVQMEMEL